MKCRLLAASALRSAVFAGFTLVLAGPAWAQPVDSRHDPAEEAQRDTAQETNSATTPANEEPAIDELDPNAPDSETILVTGSRIPRPQFEGVLPGVQVTAEQIEARGFTHLYDVLNDIPMVSPSSASVYGVNNGGQAASLGLSFADLLGLGTARTLTLVNGRRFVSSTPATFFVPGSQPGAQVDLSMIPVGLIERADIRPVAGAAAYGSDAIAGVINVILRKDFDGVRVNGLSSISDEGDAANYAIDLLAGRNFAGGRGNVTVAYEYSRNEGLTGLAREGYRENFNYLPNVRNGAVRNPNFVPSLSINQSSTNNAAFLRLADDGQPSVFFLPGGDSFLNLTLSESGQIFQAQGTQATLSWQGVVSGVATLATPRPNGFNPLNANLFLIPDGPVTGAQAGCSSSLATFCTFAPSSLPSSINAQQVINKYAPGFNTAGATASQLTTLAINLLQANLPTVREYFVSNPSALGAILGTFTPGFLDVQNTDPATASFLPRVAVPLRFDAAGNVVSYVPTRPTADGNGGTLTLARDPDAGLDRARDTVLRVMQERHIGNLLGKYDIADNLTVYTENLFARIKTISPRPTNPSHLLTQNQTETGPLVFDISNPFLDADDRAKLSAAGVVGKFTLGRTWRDLLDNYQARNETEAYRSLIGLKGDFGLFGRAAHFDVAGYYGRVESVANQKELKDIEFALAINAVRDPATGQAVCAIKLNAQFLGTPLGLPPGVAATELIRERQPDGTLTERVIVRQVTPDQVAGCQPLNPFGYNQMSQAAKDYVRADLRMTNLSEQHGVEVAMNTSLVDLPAGPLGLAFTGNYRRDFFDFRVDDISRIGGARVTAFAETAGYTETTEFGAEARIPIFGDDFHIPGFRNLEISPAVRFVRLTGNAPDLRRLDGTLDTLEVDNGWNSIWSIGAGWRPIKDIFFRGNYTRSIRSASVVELFLGQQPTVTLVSDPCGINQIQNTLQGATRRASCRAAVIAAGFAQNDAGADAFLAGFNPANSQLLGSFSGNPDISPERGRTWTLGAVLSPRSIPRLHLSADYYNVTVTNLINRPTVGGALTTCYDNPNFPNTPEFNVNLCDAFTRDPATFQISRYDIGYYNQGGLRIKAINLSGVYDLPLREVFGSDIGNLTLSGNAYHLIRYESSTANDFASGTTARAEGTFGLPKWKLQMLARYEHDRFYAQWVTNWQSKTFAYYANDPAGKEVQDLLSLPSYAIHNAAIGFYFGGERQFGLNFSIGNVLNKKHLLSDAFEGAAYALGSAVVDPIGRRYTVSANFKF